MVNSPVLEADQKSKEVEKVLQDFVDRVNSLMSWVPRPLAYLIDTIQSGLEELRRKVNEFWERFQQLRDQPGNSDKLNLVAEQWISSVGNPLGDIAADIGPTRMRASVEWEGSAAEAYKILVPTQSEGLNGIKDLAGQVNSSLKSLADSIDAFWLAVKIALVGFAVAVVGAIVAACSVVGIPAAIAAIVGAVGTSTALVTASISALNSHFDTIESEQSTLRQKIHDLGDTWTKSETDMSDASVSDGDGSDWRVNR